MLHQAFGFGAVWCAACLQAAGISNTSASRLTSMLDNIDRPAPLSKPWPRQPESLEIAANIISAPARESAKALTRRLEASKPGSWAGGSRPSSSAGSSVVDVDALPCASRPEHDPLDGDLGGAAVRASRFSLNGRRAYPILDALRLRRGTAATTGRHLRPAARNEPVTCRSSKRGGCMRREIPSRIPEYYPPPIPWMAADRLPEDYQVPT
ncbi:hypothetical protein B0T24DRAFT_149444 [Lasiosphaeria ovina]|uniref:Uncharacterized protein n=1 Tax=Lasiosphaeria ovina TaxID=92902 RepID=A0AAE0NDJ7_9PEZI|nr:hypothetical protein B0T24DRAFT_149444 [Lasiosphaeria ovina]